MHKITITIPVWCAIASLFVNKRTQLYNLVTAFEPKLWFWVKFETLGILTAPPFYRIFPQDEQDDSKFWKSRSWCEYANDWMDYLPQHERQQTDSVFHSSMSPTCFWGVWKEQVLLLDQKHFSVGLFMMEIALWWKILKFKNFSTHKKVLHAQL